MIIIEIKNCSKNSQLEGIEKVLKPSLVNTIIATLVLIAPYSHLVINVSIKNYEKLMLNVILSGVTIIFIPSIWQNYFKMKKNYKKDSKLVYDQIKLSTERLASQSYQLQEDNSKKV